MKKLQLEILSPVKPVFKGEVEAVTVPGKEGAFQVLYNHAPIISSLEIGDMKIKDNGTDELYAVSGGVVEVLDNNVLILSPAVEKATEIDVERAEAAAERARERLRDRKNPDIDFDRAELALKRAINRMSTKNK